MPPMVRYVNPGAGSVVTSAKRIRDQRSSSINDRLANSRLTSRESEKKAQYLDANTWLLFQLFIKLFQTCNFSAIEHETMPILSNNEALLFILT